MISCSILVDKVLFPLILHAKFDSLDGPPPFLLKEEEIVLNGCGNVSLNR